MKQPLAGWRHTLRTTEVEARLHFEGQAERVITLEQQGRFLEVCVTFRAMLTRIRIVNVDNNQFELVSKCMFCVIPVGHHSCGAGGDGGQPRRLPPVRTHLRKPAHDDVADGDVFWSAIARQRAYARQHG